MDNVRSSNISCLGDKVLREITSDKTTTLMWEKLESLFMNESLAEGLFLKQQLYLFRMAENKSIVEQLINFYKIIDDIENIWVNIDDKDKTLLLLSSLPRYFEHFKDVFFMVRNVLSPWTKSSSM